MTDQYESSEHSAQESPGLENSDTRHANDMAGQTIPIVPVQENTGATDDQPSMFIGLFPHKNSGRVAIAPVYMESNRGPRSVFREGLSESRAILDRALGRVTIDPVDGLPHFLTDKERKIVQAVADKVGPTVDAKTSYKSAVRALNQCAKSGSGFVYEINPNSRSIQILDAIRSDATVVAAGRTPANTNGGFHLRSITTKTGVPSFIQSADIKGVWKVSYKTDAGPATVGKGGRLRISGMEYIANDRYRIPAALVYKGFRYIGMSATVVAAGFDLRALINKFAESRQRNNYTPFFEEGARIAGGWTGAIYLGSKMATDTATTLAPRFGKAFPYTVAAISIGAGVAGSVAGYLYGGLGGKKAMDALMDGSVWRTTIPVAHAAELRENYVDPRTGLTAAELDHYKHSSSSSIGHAAQERLFSAARSKVFAKTAPADPHNVETINRRLDAAGRKGEDRGNPNLQTELYLDEATGLHFDPIRGTVCKDPNKPTPIGARPRYTRDDLSPASRSIIERNEKLFAEERTKQAKRIEAAATGQPAKLGEDESIPNAPTTLAEYADRLSRSTPLTSTGPTHRTVASASLRQQAPSAAQRAREIHHEVTNLATTALNAHQVMLVRASRAAQTKFEQARQFAERGGPDPEFRRQQMISAGWTFAQSTGQLLEYNARNLARVPGMQGASRFLSTVSGAIGSAVSAYSAGTAIATLTANAALGTLTMGVGFVFSAVTTILSCLFGSDDDGGAAMQRAMYEMEQNIRGDIRELRNEFRDFRRNMHMAMVQLGRGLEQINKNVMELGIMAQQQFQITMHTIAKFENFVREQSHTQMYMLRSIESRDVIQAQHILLTYIANTESTTSAIAHERHRPTGVAPSDSEIRTALNSIILWIDRRSRSMVEHINSYAHMSNERILAFLESSSTSRQHELIASSDDPLTTALYQVDTGVNMSGFIATYLRKTLGAHVVDEKYTKILPMSMLTELGNLYLVAAEKYDSEVAAGHPKRSVKLVDDEHSGMCEFLADEIQLQIEFIQFLRDTPHIIAALRDKLAHGKRIADGLARAATVPDDARDTKLLEWRQKSSDHPQEQSLVDKIREQKTTAYELSERQKLATSENAILEQIIVHIVTMIYTPEVSKQLATQWSPPGETTSAPTSKPPSTPPSRYANLELPENMSVAEIQRFRNVAMLLVDWRGRSYLRISNTVEELRIILRQQGEVTKAEIMHKYVLSRMRDEITKQENVIRFRQSMDRAPSEHWADIRTAGLDSSKLSAIFSTFTVTDQETVLAGYYEITPDETCRLTRHMRVKEIELFKRSLPGLVNETRLRQFKNATTVAELNTILGLLTPETRTLVLRKFVDDCIASGSGGIHFAWYYFDRPRPKQEPPSLPNVSELLVKCATATYAFDAIANKSISAIPPEHQSIIANVVSEVGLLSKDALALAYTYYSACLIGDLLDAHQILVQYVRGETNASKESKHSTFRTQLTELTKTMDLIKKNATDHEVELDRILSDKTKQEKVIIEKQKEIVRIFDKYGVAGIDSAIDKSLILQWYIDAELVDKDKITSNVYCNIYDKFYINRRYLQNNAHWMLGPHLHINELVVKLNNDLKNEYEKLEIIIPKILPAQQSLNMATTELVTVQEKLNRLMHINPLEFPEITAATSALELAQKKVDLATAKHKTMVDARSKARTEYYSVEAEALRIRQVYNAAKQTLDATDKSSPEYDEYKRAEDIAFDAEANAFAKVLPLQLEFYRSVEAEETIYNELRACEKERDLASEKLNEINERLIADTASNVRNSFAYSLLMLVSMGVGLGPGAIGENAGRWDVFEYFSTTDSQSNDLVELMGTGALGNILFDDSFDYTKCLSAVGTYPKGTMTPLMNAAARGLGAVVCGLVDLHEPEDLAAVSAEGKTAAAYAAHTEVHKLFPQADIKTPAAEDITDSEGIVPDIPVDVADISDASADNDSTIEGQLSLARTRIFSYQDILRSIPAAPPKRSRSQSAPENHREPSTETITDEDSLYQKFIDETQAYCTQLSNTYGFVISPDEFWQTPIKLFELITAESADPSGQMFAELDRHGYRFAKCGLPLFHDAREEKTFTDAMLAHGIDIRRIKIRGNRYLQIRLPTEEIYE